MNRPGAAGGLPAPGRPTSYLEGIELVTFKPVTVEKNGVVRTAETPAELVKFTWDGWTVRQAASRPAARKPE